MTEARKLTPLVTLFSVQHGHVNRDMNSAEWFIDGYAVAVFIKFRWNLITRCHDNPSSHYSYIELLTSGSVPWFCPVFRSNLPKSIA